MSKRFTITLSVCISVFFVLNLLRALSGPPAKVGVSGWRSTGFPFPVHVENVQYTAAGPVVTTIKNQPWLWVVNVGVWGFLSYRFSRRVEHGGAAWWRGEGQTPRRKEGAEANKRNLGLHLRVLLPPWCKKPQEEISTPPSAQPRAPARSCGPGRPLPRPRAAWR